MEILQDGDPNDIKTNSKSKLAEELRDVNINSYKFMKNLMIGGKNRAGPLVFK